MEELSLPPSYVNLSNFKSRVLEPSVNEINTQTDVTLSYESIKKGKKIIGYKILVKAKETAKAVPTMKGRDKNTIDMFCKLTDAQIAKYSSILSKLPELSDLSNFPTYESFAIYIGNILRDKNNTKNPKTAERIFKALHEKTDFNTN